MLKRFFENAIEYGGKVVKVTVNTRERSAIVTFDTSAGMILYKFILLYNQFKKKLSCYFSEIFFH
jgi:hypothetical protein